MQELGYLSGAFALFALFAHLLTTWLGLRRCRVPREAMPPPAEAPPISIVRPLCGVDPHEELTLRSTFELAYPRYEVLLCCASADDAIVPLVQGLLKDYPAVPARLLIGNDDVTHNPKLNNVVKGWRGAAHDWVALVDSNVLMPRDYLQRLLAAWRGDTGLVSAPPIGARPEGFWAELECAYLNTYQARWQYAADTLGLGFAQGKNMLWRANDLEAAGGILALAREPAEDAAATKVVRASGRKVRLADGAFAQPLGYRTARQVWGRQVRWARLRKRTFPGFFALEILSGLLAPLLGLVLAAWALVVDAMAVAASYCLVWFAAEAGLAAGVGWHLSWRSPLLWMVRELALPVLWTQAWLGSSLSWRGNDLTPERNDVRWARY
jgi:ceramide glucosyltransferase